MHRLEELCSGDAAETMQRACERLARSTFVLAVVGEFSSGKSFLLNALLGSFGLLATDINPSTATITEIEYANPPQAHAHHESGRVERIPIEGLSKFVASDDDPPVRVVVGVNSPFLQRGFTVADTPGLASINPAHRRATLQFLPNADAALYLIDTQQPFSEGDASFLSIIREHLDTIFIVQTKIDLWRQIGAGGKSEWENAAERIQQLAAVHAPGAYVYAISARDYVDAVATGDASLRERSRFPEFASALDASLVRNTGRARIRRAVESIEQAAHDELTRIGRDAAMLALPPEELKLRRAQASSSLEAASAFVEGEKARAHSAAARFSAALRERGEQLAQEAERGLERVFDAADIARLRDRARLHVLVDRTLEQIVDPFAREAAAAASGEYRRALDRAAQALPNVRFSFAHSAALAFGVAEGSKRWDEDPQRALQAAIVLEAIGGPAIGLVHRVAAGFRNAAPGTYMKRELTADLRQTIWPQFRADMANFDRTVTGRIARIAAAYAAALDSSLVRYRDEIAGSIDRAIAAHAGGSSAAEIAQQMQTRGERIRAVLQDGVRAASDFLDRGEEIAPADAGSEVVRRAHVDADFDRTAYQKGLRPQRWRVAVLGALRRGKSSLINAFAGHRVLADEVAGAIAFPVHVRYGESESAFALQHDGAWREIEIESALEEAAQNPVLIVTPWQLPRELVLVHAPAFDAGDSALEDVCMVAAREASEVLCLFSRQLSDRELSLYGRIADFGKPMTFVHTLADNESPSERRHVVELATQYLHERAIPARRIFTVSTLEHGQAARARRAPAAWNELDALISTIAAHAQEHMSRLERLERANALPGRQAYERQPKPGGRGVLQRVFGAMKMGRKPPGGEA